MNILYEDNTHLQAAKDDVDDEYYTHLKDIEKELVNYDFNGKIVYCCCDNPEWSNFYKYFKTGFKKLGLTGLITSHFDPSGSYYTIFDGVDEEKHPLKGNGDCRDAECQRLAKQADIIVTNPPFSIFGSIAETYKNMPFIMLCTAMKMVTNKAVWEMYKQKKIRYGYTTVRKFYRPNGEKDKIVPCIWYTNLPVHKNYKDLNIVPLDDSFQKYDNFDAYNASGKAIPDTDEMIGVPISILTRVDPNNLPFEIVGKKGNLKLDGESVFERLIIKLK